MFNEDLGLITLDEAQEKLVSPDTVLITEHQVALGTAAVLGGRATVLHGPRWIGATRVVVAAVHRAFVPSTPRVRPTRRVYPKHYAFLENASMARAMERL